MPLFKRNRNRRTPKIDYPRVAVLCPEQVQHSEAYGHLKGNVENLRVAGSITDALHLIRDEDITHFLVMTSQADPNSSCWTDALIEIREQVKRSFAVISMIEGEETHLLPARASWS